MKTNCQNLLFIVLLVFTAENLAAQNVNIPDANFKAALLAHSPVIDTNGDGEIQLSEAQSFTGTLSVNGKNIVDLTGIEAFVSITTLSCYSNKLTTLDLTSNAALTFLHCSGNQLTSLDLTSNAALTTLHCNGNQLTSLDLTANAILATLYCQENQLTSLDLTSNADLTFLLCNRNQLTALDLSANTALTTLYCDENQLTTLDVRANTALVKLSCNENQLTTLLTANTALDNLSCNTNQFTTLDLRANTALTELYCNENQLKVLDLRDNKALRDFTCHSNQLTALDLSANTALERLGCSSNELRMLDLSANTTLKGLGCDNNQITSLDLTANTALYALYCRSNQLTTLDLRNGNNTLLALNYIHLTDNSNLTCVTVDDPVWSSNNWINKDVQTKFSSNCACGVFSINMDSIQNIDCADSGFVWASVTGGNGPFQYEWLNAPLSSDSILIADSAGIYTLKTTDNNLCESSRTVILKGPKVKSGFELNTNLHVGVFRPGRLTSVDLSALNDGCSVQNAQLRLIYNGPLNFESASIVPTSQNGDTLIWDLGSMNYTGGADFLSKLNFRVDTLAQAGDRVCFEVLISPEAGDFDPSNNFKQYCFDVVNSYDPNDKQVYPQGVCAENYTLKDQPLTYTIRFQNTGNAPAIDVYLLDSLSPYLDLTSVRVLSSSHQPMVTEVLDARVLKFDFKNINLADSLSDEEASKGFVTYEISPYSGLADGTVIENTVGIYFDFNPPVITNTTKNTLTSVLPETDTTVIYDTLNKDYTFNGHKYSEAGTYKNYLYTNDGSCDSLIVLHLAQPLPVYGTDVQMACGSYTWIDGNTYISNNNTATYNILGGAWSGADSIVTLNLTMANPTTGTDIQTACGSYTWIDGNTYTSSNSSATQTFMNSQGCDSIVTLNLTVSPNFEATITSASPTLTADIPNAAYQWFDCTAGFAEITGATAQTFTATFDGEYAVTITQGSCTDTSACEIVQLIGLTENSVWSELRMFPNPTNGNVELNFGKLLAEATVNVIDAQGRIIQSYAVSNQEKLNIELSEVNSGVYFVQVETTQVKAPVLRLVKY